MLAARDSALRCGGFGLPVTKSTATHHFRVLREAGVITQVEDGTARLNALRRADLDERFPGLLDAVLGASEPGSSPVGSDAGVAPAGGRRQLGDQPARRRPRRPGRAAHLLCTGIPYFSDSLLGRSWDRRRSHGLPLVTAQG